MLGDYNAVPTIAVKDLATARHFYEDVLGLAVQETNEQAQLVMYASGSSALQVYASATAGSNQSTYATWEVPDIEALVDELSAKGVQFEHYPDMPGVQLEGHVHIWSTERAAWFKDPDGNILCAHSR